MTILREKDGKHTNLTHRITQRRQVWEKAYIINGIKTFNISVGNIYVSVCLHFGQRNLYVYHFMMTLYLGLIFCFSKALLDVHKYIVTINWIMTRLH